MPIREKYGPSFTVLGKMLGTVILMTLAATIVVAGFLMILQETGPMLVNDTAFLFWVAATILISIALSVVTYSRILEQKIQWTY